MLTLTENAQKAVARFIVEAGMPVEGLRISVTEGGCSGMQYGMALEDEIKQQDTVVACGEIKVLVDAESFPRLDGVVVDYLDGMQGSGFKFENPNATKNCNCGKSFAC